MDEEHFAAFPRLRAEPYDVTSPPTSRYNCIAWAAEDTSQWWWPDNPDAFWPARAPRVRSLDAFREAFATLGYEPCANEELESGCEKIAIYANDAGPTHAARQLPSGEWTSKLGHSADISHTLSGLEGPVYGSVVAYLKRPTG